MADEYFYGATLKATGDNVVWDPERTDSRYPRNHKLILKQCVLGHEAKDNEYHVVQAETMAMGEIVRIPIAVLKVGETRHCCLDLEFPEPPVTFTLIEGSGPIYLHGSHILGAEEGEDGMDEMGEEEVMDEEDGAEEEEELAKKKAKLATNNVKGAKVVANANNKPAVAAAANKKK